MRPVPEFSLSRGCSFVEVCSTSPRLFANTGLEGPKLKSRGTIEPITRGALSQVWFVSILEEMLYSKTHRRMHRQ
jgi:hypothetical protein